MVRPRQSQCPKYSAMTNPRVGVRTWSAATAGAPQPMLSKTRTTRNNVSATLDSQALSVRGPKLSS